MNKILLSGVTTFAALAVVVGGTTAFFSSQASVTGNTIAAGTMNLLLTEAEGGNSPSATQSDIWQFDEMAPGGAPEQASVWLRNSGSVPGETLGIAIANGWTNPSNIAGQMRITEMTLDGNNLLEGGAGATIPDYEGPTNCDLEVNFGANDYTTIGDAVSNANNGDVICVGPGSYSDTWEPNNPIDVNQEVTIASTEGPDTTSSIGFDVTADNVTIAGFAIVDPNATNGVFASNVSGLTVTHNHIKDIASANTSGSAQGIYLDVNTTPMADIEFSNNRIENIGNTGLPVSAKGIYIGDTAGGATVDGITIEHNVIDGVAASTQSTYAAGGRGGYGIMSNNAGNSKDMLVKNNSVRNLTGMWATAIGLEGNTQDAVVELNDISSLNANDVAGNTGVNFEDNIYSTSVAVDQNNFESDMNGVIINPNFTSFTGTVDATNNWWGDFDPSDQIIENNGTVDTGNFAGGPFAGFVNGNDFNSNGFADLGDLRNDPVTNSDITLEEYTGTEDKEFVMGVQLDGPTTDNSFQGLALDDMELVFTLEQI